MKNALKANAGCRSNEKLYDGVINAETSRARARTRARALATVVTAAFAAAPMIASAIDVVEYYNRSLDAYFLTGRATEQALLDAAADFSRTGMRFTAEPAANASSLGLASICRYYVSLATPFVSSHFYGRDDTDCALIRSLTPQGFVGEGLDFAVTPASVGACPAQAPVAVYRSFRTAKNGRTSNHRYTVSAASYAATLSTGWEGEQVAFCVSAATDVAAPISESFKRVVSAASTPFSAGCNAPASGTLYSSAEVEPSLARNPRDHNHMLAAWQQDRWSNGGAQGLAGAVTFDGGRTWQQSTAPFSRCSGGTVTNGGDYERASDPWVTVGLDGVTYQMALGFSGETFTNSGLSAMLVSRSSDGGRTWAQAQTLVRDLSADIFHDKNMIIADPNTASHAYAVWGRLNANGTGPAWFTRTTDSGATWEPSRAIYEPGNTNQTFGNQIVVLPDGTLVNVFLAIIRAGNSTNSVGSEFRVIRSTDKGVTWSAPITISRSLGVGTLDPETSAPMRDGAGLASMAVGKDGVLHVVWQDARFGFGNYDGVAYSRSTDGGRNWTNPVAVNARIDVPAFVPTVHVRDDGVVGVSYYDFRDNTAAAGSLPTTYRLAVSSDGMTWRESEINAAFEMNRAPIARGRFLGDYQALSSNASAFSALYVRTTAPNQSANASDITEVMFANLADGSLKRAAQSYRATPAPADFVPSQALLARVAQATERAVAWRMRGAAFDRAGSHPPNLSGSQVIF